MFLTKAERIAKLRKLMEIEGWSTIDDLLEMAALDVISPGICVSRYCSYSCETEPDQREGWCEICSANTVQPALVLAGVI